VGETGRLSRRRVAVLRRWKGKIGSVEELLAAAGYDAASVFDDSIEPSRADVVWVQGNINWYPRARRLLAALPEPTRPKVLVWHSEPLPFPHGSGFPRPRLTVREIAKIILRDQRATDAYTNYYRLKQMHRRGLIDLCVVTSRSRQNFLAEKGIPSHFVPLGSHAGVGRRMNLDRDIDVLFIGTLDDSRHRSALKYLRANGINVEAVGSWKAGPSWGEPRTELINRAKIFLNIQRHAGQYSGYRMLLGLMNGAMVVSEPVHDPFPYEPGVHYVESTLETMPVAIPKYLSGESARSAIVANGHRFATETLTMENSMRQIINLMETMLGNAR
jgi:hypothetical protein